MSEKDNATKAFMEKNENFADAFNFLMFNGKQVIKAENLKSIDTTLLSFPSKNNKKLDSKKKYRDVLKTLSVKQDDRASYILLAIENQSKVHYAMPVRNMLYDAMQYEMQVKEIEDEHKAKLKKDKNYKLTSAEFLSGFTKKDKLKPVITLVINFSDEPWDAPVYLSEMIEPEGKPYAKFMANYRINLIDPFRIRPRSFKKFSSHLKEILLYLKCSRNEKNMKKMLETEESFKHAPNEVVGLINILTGSTLKIDEKEEKTNMCKAWDQMIERSKKEGQKEGQKEGFINAIKMLYKLNLPFKQIVASIKDSFGYSEKEIVKEIHTLYPDFS